VTPGVIPLLAPYRFLINETYLPGCSSITAGAPWLPSRFHLLTSKKIPPFIRQAGKREVSFPQSGIACEA